MLKVQLTPQQNIWFFSDPHYDHAGIVRGTSNWEAKRGTRDFDTLEAHNEALVSNINAVVKKEDILFCLGDWSFGGYKTKDNVKNVGIFRNKLNCDTIHLIEGNHDDEIRKKPELQELFTSVQPYLEVQVARQYTGKKQGVKAIKQHIILCHYAMRVWNKSHHGSWMLYGHSHGSLDEFTPITANFQWIGDRYFIKNYRTMDVGIDTHPKMRPYSFSEIEEIMQKRSVELEIDHHEKSL